MIVDSSALVAVLLQEPRHEQVLSQLEAAESVRVGAPTLVETGIVLSARIGAAGKSLLARLIDEARAEVVEFDAEHWSVAVDAFLRYGKGRSPAALNFGDCLTYAVAKVSGETLLCVGDDFPKTDLPLAAVGP